MGHSITSSKTGYYIETKDHQQRRFKMRKVKVVFYVLALVLIGLSAYAQEGINWEKGYVEAKGFGAPPANARGAQKRVLARRAAIVDGYRNLAEIINGVQVSSETTVEDFVVKSDVIKTKVDALIKGAQIVDEKSTPEGGYEVTMRISLRGKNGLNKVLIKEAKKEEVKKYKTEKKPLPPPLPKPRKLEPEPEEYEKTYAAQGDYTGLIIDARGLGLKPAMSPKILTLSGDVVYGVLKIEGDELAELVNEKGIVGYAKTLDEAKASWRAGSNPLVIKGKTVSGRFKADVTISDADGEKIMKENEKTAFLQHLRVTLVY